MNEKIEQIKKIYEEAFQTFEKTKPIPEIEIRFYPYIGINHTIRVRNGKIFVRIAEICREMPLEGQKALAYILVAKILRKKVPPKAREVYTEFIKTQEIREQALENKKTRGRKIITSAKGEVYDLDEIFDDINEIYFRDAIPKPVLSWSSGQTFRILGHHDSTHQAIIISKSLDDKKVPPFVVEYVVYHEMLHIFHPVEIKNGRRVVHSPQFKRNERKFQYFEEAEKWIAKNVRSLRKKVLKQKKK
ncbi:MAG TPA: hypothetical protein PKY59_11290 [Pyrinomonadaceae bacterium]|nr:hypothetical protein [Pyrinomonadaceae bacterium]